MVENLSIVTSHAFVVMTQGLKASEVPHGQGVHQCHYYWHVITCDA